VLEPDEFVQLASEAGIGDQPFAASLRLNDQPLVSLAHGSWQNGLPVCASDRFYGASLTKQLTGTAVALLARDGRLNVDAALGHFLPELPRWRDSVSLRHLLHHTGGMPEAGALEGAEPKAKWTNARAMAQLQGLASLPVLAGVAFHYSNAGYIALAEVVSRVSGDTFSRFVATRILDPLGLSALIVWDEGPNLPFPKPHIWATNCRCLSATVAFGPPRTGSRFGSKARTRTRLAPPAWSSSREC
jgi:CubicO group peptidase (beta-lactamase class C family)